MKAAKKIVSLSLLPILLLSATLTRAQIPVQIPTQIPTLPTGAPSRLQLPQQTSPQQASELASAATPASPLPDSPGAVQARQDDVVAIAEASFKASGDSPRSCDLFSATKVVYVDPNRYDQIHKPCAELIYPYQRFLNTNVAIPLTWQQKGYLALHDLTDPANFATIVGISAITIGIDPRTAYGPGLEGFGTIAGISLLQDATGQFFGVFALPALLHQDPRYYRMPHATISHRILYSVSRTFVSRNDDGSSMPNYSTLLTYPITAAIANVYVPGLQRNVPGLQRNVPATTQRVLIGLASDPSDALIGEFLPDVARRIHIRVTFFQRIINDYSTERQ